MRIAALYDIHGNLPALEAVLAEIFGQAGHGGVDRVVVGGDIVPGPMWREVLDRLLALPAPVDFIQGNCEVAVLGELAGRPTRLPEQAREAIRYTAQHITQEEQRLLAQWPKTLRLRVEGVGDVLFCHGTPRHENEIFSRATDERLLLPIFEPLNAAVVVCGHTHMHFDRLVGRTRVLNAGSVGMPFGVPGAYWLMLAPEPALRRTQYDLGAAAARIRATRYPQAEDFASRSVLSPPSEQQMLELFARAELREGAAAA
ncbi:MAG TPA: metallophosphoesterase family protein [Terriglobales bacterium]|nr:metallophosphoesterase family protein [Terriglobales bacterium]